VALGANFYVDFRDRRPRFEGIPASALHGGAAVPGMDSWFHDVIPLCHSVWIAGAPGAARSMEI
jgi:hypothetical protein